MAQPIKINKVYRQLIGEDGTLRKDVRYFEVYGGRRSAKSFDTMQILGITAMKESGHFIPCIRKVAATLKDSVMAEIEGFLTTNNIPHYRNKTDKEYVLPNGSRFRCFGLDDASKLKSLKGASIIWNEEANELTEDDFDSLDAGLSPTKYPGRIICTHNPVPRIEGRRIWLENRFLDIPHKLSVAAIDKEKNALVLRTWYKDNAFCPAETVRVLEGYEETNPEKYKLWALGEFTTLQGVIFDNWDIVDEIPFDTKNEGYGLDFGFTVDPASLVKVHSRPYGNESLEIWLDELFYSTGLNNYAIAQRLKELGVERYEEIIADSAEPKSIDEIAAFGYNLYPCVKGPDVIRAGIMFMKSLKIHVTRRSTNLIKEMSTYCWKRDRNNKEIPVPVDRDNHAIDAARYRIQGLIVRTCPELGRVLSARRRSA